MIIVNYITLLIKMQERNSAGGEHCVLSGPSFKNKNPEDKSSDFDFGGGWEIRTPAPGFPRLTI